MFKVFFQHSSGEIIFRFAPMFYLFIFFAESPAKNFYNYWSLNKNYISDHSMNYVRSCLEYQQFLGLLR